MRGLPGGNGSHPPPPTRHGIGEGHPSWEEDARSVWNPWPHGETPVKPAGQARIARPPFCWLSRYVPSPWRAPGLPEARRQAKPLYPARSFPVKKTVGQILATRPRSLDMTHGSWFGGLPEWSSGFSGTSAEVFHRFPDQFRGGAFRAPRKPLKITINRLLDMNGHSSHMSQPMSWRPLCQHKSLWQRGILTQRRKARRGK